jgi:hypothetical protein
MLLPDYGIMRDVWTARLQLRYNAKSEDDTRVSFPPSRCVSDGPSDAVTALDNNSSE